MAIDPEIDRAIRRLKALRWDAHAKEFEPGRWVVSCQKWAFGFNTFAKTAREAWLEALAKAEEYAGKDP